MFDFLILCLVSLCLLTLLATPETVKVEKALEFWCLKQWREFDFSDFWILTNFPNFEFNENATFHFFRFRKREHYFIYYQLIA